MNDQITLAYVRSSVLSICYTDEQINALLARLALNGGTESLTDVLLSIPVIDARRVIAGLLLRPALIEWSAASARRAREYAARYAAAAAAAARYAAAACYAAARRSIYEKWAELIVKMSAIGRRTGTRKGAK